MHSDRKHCTKDRQLMCCSDYTIDSYMTLIKLEMYAGQRHHDVTKTSSPFTITRHIVRGQRQSQRLDFPE